ncbi:MAG: MG2 domain-containing protein [Bacteroidota bacterium]
MKSLFLVCIFFTALYLSSIGQDLSPINNLATKIKVFNKYKPAEKVYLQTDKDVYSPGEDLWFSTFIVDYTTLKPSGISQSLYIDIINIYGQKVASGRSSNANGSSQGTIMIPDSLSNGIYQIVCYSSLQRKTTSPDYYFRKTIKLGNAFEPIKFELETAEDVLKLICSNRLDGNRLKGQKVKLEQFDHQKILNAKELITNSLGEIEIPVNSDTRYITLKSKFSESLSVYHAAIKKDTLLIDVMDDGYHKEGTLSFVTLQVKSDFGSFEENIELELYLNEKIVDRKVTDYNGRVSFKIANNLLNKYRVVAKHGDNRYSRDLKLSLTSNDKAYDLVQRKLGNRLIFNTYSNYEGEKTLYLVGEMRGKMRFASTIKINKEFTFGLDISDYPSGILNTYLLDFKGKVLKKNTILIDMRSVDYGLNITNHNDSAYVISLIDSSHHGYVNLRRMEKNRLFSGKGIDEYFYFYSEISSKSESYNLQFNDDLLLKNAPERYRGIYESIGNNITGDSSAYGYDLISGRAFFRNGRPFTNQGLILYNPTQLKSWLTETDDLGKFKFDEFNIEDGESLVISTVDKKTRKEVFFEFYQDSVRHDFFFSKSEWPWIDSRREEDLYYFDEKTIVLDNLVKEGKKYYHDVENRKTRLDNIVTVKGDQLQPGSAGGDLGLIPLIQQVTPIYAYDRSTGRVLLRPPKTINAGLGVIFYLDNMRIGDNIFNIGYLNETDIEEVKVFKGLDALMFPFAPDGVIQFITKRGESHYFNIKSVNTNVLPPFYNTDLDLAYNKNRLWLNDKNVNLNKYTLKDVFQNKQNLNEK